MSEQQTLARQGGRSRSFLACSEHESRLSRTVVRCARNCRRVFTVVSFISRRRLLAWPAMRTRRCKRTSATPRISSFLPPMQDRCVHGPSSDPSARIHAVQIFIRVVHLPSTEIYYSCVHTLPSISNLFSPELTQCVATKFSTEFATRIHQTKFIPHTQMYPDVLLLILVANYIW